MENPKSIGTYILGVRVDIGLSMAEILNRCNEAFNDFIPGVTRHRLISTTNPEFIIEAQKDDTFKDVINQSFLSVPDGIGVLIADKYLSGVDFIVKNIKSRWLCFLARALYLVVFLPYTWILVFVGSIGSKRVPGVELSRNLLTICDEKGLGVFILGGRGATAALAVEKMKFKYKNINIIGYSSEYSSGAEDDAKTVKFILKCLHDVKVNHIDLLLVGYGHSKQEKWISRNADAINANVCVGVGGFLDVEAQLVKEAPKYIKRMGLEWLHRLVTQRWRYKRVWNAVAVFLTKVLLSS